MGISFFTRDGVDRLVITGQEIVDWSPVLREQMLDWFRANGITPEDVRVCTESPAKHHAYGVDAASLDVGVCIGGGEIIYEEIVRDERGNSRIRACVSEILSVERTVSMVVPVPPPYASVVAKLEARAPAAA
jgi:hypothetical protein